MQTRLQLTARRQELTLDEHGYRGWRVCEEPLELDPARTALLLCDVWDHHWCRGAVERLEFMLPQIDATARAARDMGMLVVHAPSGTMQAYADHPARKRVLQAPPVPVPKELPHLDPPHPIDGERLLRYHRRPGTRARSLDSPARGGVDRPRARRDR